MEQDRDKLAVGDSLSGGENRAELPPSNGGAIFGRLQRWRLGRQFVGWGCMAIGVAGLILPVLPGWIFLAWGAVTLAPDVPFFARLLDWVAERVPPLRSAIERVRGVPQN